MSVRLPETSPSSALESSSRAVWHGPTPHEAFATLVGEVRTRVEHRLGAILDIKLREASRHSTDACAVVKALEDLILRGGKRLRAALAAAGYMACGGARLDDGIIEAGVALELLQAYMLVHDDWMDQDDVRRGGPSVHAILRKHFASTEKGDAGAILAGDFASGVAQEVLAAAPVPPAVLLRAMSFFAEMQQSAFYGQLLDLVGRSEDVEAMHALKTGSYSVRGPLLLGAILGDASASQREALVAFAGPLGVAFQLRDDLLGIFGLAEVTGKPVGNDLRQGKRTALIVESERLAGPAAKRTIAQAFGVTNASEADVSAAVRALEDCGARAAVERRIDALVETARAPLRASTLSSEGAILLEGAAVALTARRL